MLTILQRVFFPGTLTAILVLCPCLSAQETQEVQPAPVPPQILAAKKVFIANAPGDPMIPSIGGNNLPYDAFYAAVKSWGHYELVSSPAEADLVFEVSFTNSLAGVGGSSSGCASSTASVLRLVIVDPRTRSPLWWFAEQVVPKRKRFGWKPIADAFRDTMPKLVDDVKKLAATPENVGAKG